MKWLKPHKDEEKLIKMLKRSKQDFRFDHNQIRFSLLQSLARAPRVEAKSFSYKLAVSFASLVLFVGLGTTFAFADAAKPGDKLFPIDTFEEKVLLKLPLPQETKAQMRTSIVAERVRELNQITKTQPKDEIKLQAIEASEQSLNNAIESVATNRDKLKKRGKAKRAAKLEATLNKLEDLADKQEVGVDRIKRDVTDSELKNKIDERIKEIHRLKRRAQPLQDQQDEINETRTDVNDDDSQDLKNLLE